MFRLDTTIVAYLAAAVMLVGGGLWIVFDSPTRPILRQIVGGEVVAPTGSAPLTREQLSELKQDVESAHEALRNAERDGSRLSVQEALKLYDKAQRRYTAARLQALEAESRPLEME